MNKIITVNIGGRAIKIEEDAHSILEKYLKRLESNYSYTENGSEILEDIEARISDLLQEISENGMGFIRPDDVNKVIEKMGDPSEFEDENEDYNSHSKHQKSESYKKNNQKKLYRDSDDRMIGGVCAGIAKYFNITPGLVRVLTIISFFTFGVGFLPYIILWAIIPKANTAAEKLEMNGKNPTIENIASTIRKEANDVADSLRNNGRIGDFFSELFSMILKFSKVILKILVGVFMTLLVITAIALFLALIVGVGTLGFSSFAINLSDIYHITDSSSLEYLIRISLFLILIIPIVGIILFIVNIVKKISRYKQVATGLWLSWFVFLIIFIGSIIYTVKNIGTKGEVLNEISVAQVDTLYLHYSNIGSSIENKDLNTSFVKFKNNENISLIETKNARGNSEEEAENYANSIVSESYVEGNNIYLDENYEKTSSNILRNQEVSLLVKAPKGTVIYLHNDIQLPNHSMSYRIGKTVIKKERVKKGSKVLKKGFYTMAENGLKCHDCENEKQQNGKQKIFKRIEVNAPLHLILENGEINNIKVSEGVDYSIESGLLKIDYKKDIDEFAEFPEVHLTINTLKKITINSAINVDLDGLSLDELTIELNGAGKFEGENLDVSTLNLDLNGAASIDLDGVVDELNIAQNGGAKIDAYDLKTNTANIEINGVVSCKLNVEKSIIGSISGVGKLSHKGSPELEIETDGIIKVIQK